MHAQAKRIKAGIAKLRSIRGNNLVLLQNKIVNVVMTTPIA